MVGRPLPLAPLASATFTASFWRCTADGATSAPPFMWRDLHSRAIDDLLAVA